MDNIELPKDKTQRQRCIHIKWRLRCMMRQSWINHTDISLAIGLISEYKNLVGWEQQKHKVVVNFNKYPQNCE